ncbi:MAG: inositol 2-dehydrogenase [Rhodoferax sp.]|nr:inositol 2-dehydrogenase [Rhodoferax sp.]MBP7492600.1 inositol 2-dehydrogenase [Rhodoferax sp.]
MKKVALFGAGRIGRIHAANLSAMPGVELVAVSDPVAASSAELAHTFGARVDSIENIFADARIDAVVIGSPTTTHSDLITRAAAAGKHIFCEKPVDLSAVRAQACADAVAQAGVACMIGFQRRFDPTFNEAKARLERGEIGTPEMLIITSRDPGAPPVDYIKQSGGIFRDMLIHDFDVFRWILCSDGDEAAWLSATGSCLTDPAIGEAGDMDCTAVTIRTQKGRLCQINTTRRAAYGYDQRFEVIGSTGMLQCGNHRPSEVTQANAKGTCVDNPEAFFLQRYAAAYRLEIEHFFTQLQTGGTFLTTIADGVQAQKLADAAAHSAASGQAVSF